MSYYRFNRKEIFQKAKERHSKEKAAEYYLQRDRQKNLSKEEKDKIKEYQRKDISTKKKHNKSNESCFCSA